MNSQPATALPITDDDSWTDPAGTRFLDYFQQDKTTPHAKASSPST
jgi:hypothetical protein